MIKQWIQYNLSNTIDYEEPVSLTKKPLIVQLNSMPVRRIELNTKVCADLVWKFIDTYVGWLWDYFSASLRVIVDLVRRYTNK